MPAVIPVERFTTDLFAVLGETFERVEGIYLDRGTSLFETLAAISAEEASQPVGTRCACLAAQVEHVAFYIDVLTATLRGEEIGEVDWDVAWQRTGATPDEWTALNDRLRDSYDRAMATMRGIETWDADDRIGEAIAIAVHTAYHLGEIRQALCTIKP